MTLAATCVGATPKKPILPQRLVQSAEQGNVDWQALLRETDKLTKRLGEEGFDLYLNLALAGRNSGNFI